MKELLRKNKVGIITAVLVILFGGLLFWPNKKTQEIKTNKEILNTNTLLQGPNEISFGGVELKVPDKLPVIAVKDGWINSERTSQLLNLFEMTSAKIKINTPTLIMYQNDKATLTFKTTEKEIDYQIVDATKTGEVKRDEETIRTDFQQRMQKIIEMRKTKMGPTTYWKSDYRAYETTKGNSDFVVMSSYFVYSDSKMLNKEMSAGVVAEYDWGGELKRMRLHEPYGEIDETENIKTSSWEEIKKIEAGKWEVLNISGGKEYTMSNEKANYQNMRVDTGEVEYIFDINQDRYYPYLVLEGTATISGEAAKVRLGFKFKNEN